MKKLLLSILFLFMMVSVYAQQGQQYYRYSIVRVILHKKAYVIKMDDGVTEQVLQNESGKYLRFGTSAGALNYLVSLGWEFEKVEPMPEGDFSNLGGRVKTKSYWIFRKPCTKEELDAIVKNSLVLEQLKND